MNAEDKKKFKDIGKEIADTFSKIKNVIKEMFSYQSYNEAYKELNDLLTVFTLWEKTFKKTGTLDFITPKELLDIYYKIEDIKDRYLYNSSIGNEGELSDCLSIWMWNLMVLRKDIIDIEIANVKKCNTEKYRIKTLAERAFLLYHYIMRQ